MATNEQLTKPSRMAVLQISPEKFAPHLQKISQKKPQPQHQPTHSQQQQQQDPFLLADPKEALRLHRQLHPLWDPENIPTDHDNVHLIDPAFPPTMRSAADYADLEPTFNDVSHHLLDSTAFTSCIGTSSAHHMRRAAQDVESCYSKIAASTTITAKSALLAPDAGIDIDEEAVDYDRIGVLFEWGQCYYFMYVPRDLPDSAEDVKGTFLPKHLVGWALMYEWEAIPKRKVWTRGLVATGELGNGSSRWRHSTHVMRLRVQCAQVVKAVLLAAKERRVPEQVYVKAVRGKVAEVFARYWEGVGREEKRMRVEAKGVWGEFMVDDEEEEADVEG